jgi:hypothetical protein
MKPVKIEALFFQFDYFHGNGYFRCLEEGKIIRKKFKKQRSFIL